MWKRFMQTKVYMSFFTMSEKKNSQTFKIAAAKSFFSNVYVIDTTCFDECFLFHVSTRSYYFS